jgi:archaellum biogenesis ATPase FlaH
VLEQVAGAAKWRPKPDPGQVELAREAEDLLVQVVAGNATAPPKAAPIASRRKRELRRRAVTTIEARAVEWLIPNVVPLGTLSLVAGVGGLGKSALVLAWAAEVTREGKNVLVVSYEDAAEQVIRPRFEALNGDLERLYELSVDPLEGSISFPSDLDELARHATETEARLIVIDPVSASIDLKLDSHKDAHVRVVLGRLAKLAERLGLAVVMIAHLNKAPSGDVYLRVNGSTAFYNASRSVLTVTRDQGEELHRLVAHHKSNYGLIAQVERWALQIVEVPSATGPLSVARLVFLEVADDVSRDDVLAPHVPEKRSEAELLIMTELAGGRRLSSLVKDAGVNAGISKSTVERAARSLEVVVEEETTDSGRVTYWTLPKALGGHVMPSSNTFDVIPPAPHDQRAEGVTSGGSPQAAVEGDDATPCPRHEGLHRVVKRTAGLVYLSCGCHRIEGES